MTSAIFFALCCWKHTRTHTQPHNWLPRMNCYVGRFRIKKEKMLGKKTLAKGWAEQQRVGRFLSVSVCVLSQKRFISYCSVEKAQHFAASVLAASLFVVHDAVRRREHQKAKLARRQQVLHPPFGMKIEQFCFVIQIACFYVPISPKVTSKRGEITPHLLRRPTEER